MRALQSPDGSTRNAATYYDANQVSLRLNFDAAYSGPLHLYAVDWDSQERRETITVDDGTGPRVFALDSDFSQGAWVNLAINVAAGGSVQITVDRDAGANAVLSGIFLGDGGNPSGPPPDPGADSCPSPNAVAGPPAFPIGAWEAPSASFGRWRARGVNTMVYTLDGFPESTAFSEWQRRLRCQDLYTIRPPMQSLVQENADARLLALAQPDEPDIHAPAKAQVAPNYASWKSDAPSKPVFMDLSADHVLNVGDSGKQAYQELMASADWLGQDLYPIAGYNRPDWVDLSQTAVPPNGSVLDTLQGWSGGKSHYSFIEASNMNGPPYRSPTPDEFRGEIWDAVIHGTRGIFYYVAGPSGDDSVEPGVAAEMTRQDALMSSMGPILAQPGTRQPAPAPFELATRTYCGTTYTIVLNFSHQPASYDGRSYAPYEVSVSPAPPQSVTC